jgi:N6-adenosine-specific RNA methylase IME4
MRYRTIVADPPWDHSDGTGVHITVGLSGRARDGGSVVTPLPYAVMSVAQIAALPVSDLAERDAHLYLWATNRYLRHVWEIVEGWSFEPVCLLTWCKSPSGWSPGGTFGSTTEFCLFARRGALPASGSQPTRWWLWPRRRGAPTSEGGKRIGGHSAKPEAFLDVVESVSPGPYLELFARRQRLGWDTWGDEALKHVQLGESA